MCIRLCVTNSKKIFFWQITLQKTQKTLNRQHHRNGIKFSLFSHEILWMKKCPRWKISNIFESKLWNQILLSLHLTTHKNFWQSFLDFYILSVFDLVLQTLCVNSRNILPHWLISWKFCVAEKFYHFTMC